MEGLWQTERGAPLLLFAWPDATTRSNRFEIAVPRGASLILTHHLDGEVRGLDDFPDRNPPVAPVFWGFRIMVGMGLAMWLVSWLATLDLRRGEPRPLTTRALQIMMFAGWVAVVAGWYVTEIGRQPFLVYGVLRTADAAGPVAGSRDRAHARDLRDAVRAADRCVHQGPAPPRAQRRRDDRTARTAAGLAHRRSAPCLT